MSDHPVSCLCAACVARAEKTFSIFGDVGSQPPRGITMDDVAAHEPVFMAKVVREMVRRATLAVAAGNKTRSLRTESPTMTEPQFTDVVDRPKTERSASRVILAMAHDVGIVLLCEESSALDFVQEYNSASGIDGFVPADCGVEVEQCRAAGIFVGELRVINGGPESWEMPHIHDYYAEIRKLRSITKEEWKAHLAGEWPEGWNDPPAPMSPAR